MAVYSRGLRGWWLAGALLTLAIVGCLAAGTSASARPAPAASTSVTSPATLPYTPCTTLSFAPPVMYPAGIRPRSAAISDFNNDTHPDLVVTDYSSRTMSIFLGNGDGTFQPVANYETGLHPVVPAVGDLNHDNHLDLVIANYDNGNVSVLRGNGDGTFQPTEYYPSNPGPYGATIGDFNEDTHPDVATSNVNFGTINVMMGNGFGSLQGPEEYQAGLRPQVVSTADFNGDGHLDLVTPNYTASTISILFGNGNGTFQNRVTVPVEDGPDYVMVADLNGDNHPDLVAPHYSTGNISVLLGNGNGTFQPEALYSSGGANPLFASAGDFNGDGILDLAVANYGSNTVAILLGNGNGTFQSAVTFPTGAGTSPVTVIGGQFNTDTRLDMFVSNENTDNMSVFISNCGLGTATPTNTPGAPSSTATHTPTNSPTPDYTRTPTPTPTRPTATVTSTSTGTAGCYYYFAGATTTCTISGVYAYSMVFDLVCNVGLSSGLTENFDVAPSNSGPWTTFDSSVFSGGWAPGYFTITRSLTETPIPSQYAWYRITLTGGSPGGHYLHGETTPALICAAATSTPTNTPTGPTATVTSCAMPFTDVHPTDYFYEAVHYLYCHGAISGYGTVFQPYNLTTRGQITKIVVLAEAWPIYDPPSPTFQDVPTDHPFYQYIEVAYHQGIISGYGCGTGCLEFRPGANVTRAQLCKIVVLAEGWQLYTPVSPTFSDVPMTHAFYAYIETSYAYSIITGYQCGAGCLQFRPDGSATRGQICKVVYLAVTRP